MKRPICECYHPCLVRTAALRQKRPSTFSASPERFQNLHRLGVHELVAADDIARGERVVMAFDARHDTAGLAYHGLPGRDVPGLQVAFPIAVEPPCGDEGHVEGGGAKAAQACDLVLGSYGDSALNSRSVIAIHRLTSCIGKSAHFGANSYSEMAPSVDETDNYVSAGAL